MLSNEDIKRLSEKYDVIGDYHPSPARCKIYIDYELERRSKQEAENG